MPTTWNSGPSGPKTVDALRAAMKKKIQGKTGKQLIDDKFTKDHIFLGHSGDVISLASKLCKLREKPLSTLMISSMIQTANKEVENWIDSIAAQHLTLTGTTWSISRTNSTVPMLNSYKFATVDYDALKRMNADDIRKKARKYITISLKTPSLACQFDLNGMPKIYHLDY